MTIMEMDSNDKNSPKQALGTVNIDKFSDPKASLAKQTPDNKVVEIVKSEFDTEFYIQSNKDLFFSEISPLDHYLIEGWREGRRPRKDFNPFAYRYMYSDVSHLDVEPFFHYLTIGRKQSRHKDFTLDLEKLAAIEAYVDQEWYCEVYPDVKNANLNPVFHYYYWGWKEGRNPSLNFSTNDYLAAHPSLLVKQCNPLLDFLSSELEFNADDLPETTSLHNVDFSGEPLVVMCRLFDSGFYLRNNPDVAAAGIDPFQHFCTSGWKESRAPNAWFSSKFYLEAYEDVLNPGLNPFLHFITSGRSENRKSDYPNTRNGLNLAFDYWKPSQSLAIPVMRSRFDYDELRKRRGQQGHKARILVHLHVFYENVIDLIANSLRNIPESFDVVVTCAKQGLREAVAKALSPERQPFLNAWSWVDCENCGRDIAPWVVDVLPMADGYEIGLHIHTKHSQEKGRLGSRWCNDLLEKLLYDPLYVEHLLGLFTDTSVGLVYPTPYAEIESQLNWGLNRSLAQSLLFKMLGPQALLKRSPPEFPAGMMFWFRPSAMAAISKLGLRYSDFPAEPIRDDGTLGHALERTVATIVEKAGFAALKVRPASAENYNRRAAGPEISVVIPARNAEMWISDCLESIRDQVAETPAYEVIVIENNSTDATRQILKRYKNFPEIRVTSVDCAGAGGARNAGLALAKGRYVMFVDADDLIVRDALITLYAEAEKHKASMTCSQLRMFYPDSLIERAMPQALEPFQRVIHNNKAFASGTNYKVEPYVENSLRCLLNDFGPCCKLYLRSFLLDKGISFQEGVNFEDNLFVYKAYRAAQTICLLPKVTYLYRKPRHKTVNLTQSTVKSRAAFIDQIRALDSIISQVVEPMSNEAWRRVAIEAVNAKFTYTLSQYSDWMASPTMREPAVALADLIQQKMRAV